MFRVPLGGGDPEQVTSDPTHKTQPASLPLGDRIAFTVFSHRAHSLADPPVLAPALTFRLVPGRTPSARRAHRVRRRLPVPLSQHASLDSLW